MVKSKVVDQYFEKLEKNLDCKVTNQIAGSKYSFLKEDEKNEVLRFLIDDNLSASISKIKLKKTYSINYIEESDLLIIGFCLNGKKTINYRGKNTIKMGEIFYFRPIKDFSVDFSDNSFLYYFLDLKCFENTFNCKKPNPNCRKKYSNSYINHICERGEIIIEKVPYVMKSYVDEIKEIKKIEINNFLDYTNLKGELFNYLNWFIKLRLRRKPKANKKRCGLCYAAKAKKIIIDNLEEQITVTEIAEILDISVYRLQKSFKKVEGTTVYNFILKTKIDNSKSFLKDSNLSIIDISQKVGYINPSKFSTAFKNITGYTPTEYREISND